MIIMEQISIAYLMPTYADIPPRVLGTHLVSCLLAERRGIEIRRVGIQEKQLICHARNALAEEFLKSDCTHALWVDSDVVLPPHAVWCLAELDKDMVSGIYFQKVAPPYMPTIYSKRGFSKWKKGERAKHTVIIKWEPNTYFHVDACGFGCVLIKREVFERIKAPWFKWTEESGEDIGFCIRVRKAGFEIFADSRILCGHIGPKGEITYEDYKKQALPATTYIKYNPETGKHETVRDAIVEERSNKT